jgi:hypothetical protein
MDTDMFDDMYTNNEPSTSTGLFMNEGSWSALLSNSEPSPSLCLPPSSLHLPSSSRNSSPSSLYPPPFSHDPSPSHQAPLSHQAPPLHQALSHQAPPLHQASPSLPPPSPSAHALGSSYFSQAPSSDHLPPSSDHTPSSLGQPTPSDRMLSSFNHVPPSFRHVSLASNHPRSSCSGIRSAVPFSFRGGALCIVPPASSNSNVISLNSNDETNMPPPGKPSPHPGHALLHTNDSDSSFLSGGPAPFNYFSPSSNDVGHPSRHSDAVSTPHTSQAEASTSTGGGKRRASSKHSRTSSAPTPTTTTQVANITSKVHDLLLTGESFSRVQHEEKGRRRDAHYHDKEAQRHHECWKAEHDAAEMTRKQEFELQMANMRVKQMELELELVRAKHAGDSSSS